MPPSLPIEVEERIIGFLADGYRYYKTIKSCALVCRAWLPKSRAYLFQNVRLPGSQHLHNMLSLPSSTIEHIAYNAREVEGRSSFNGEAFHHLIPHFLATKLPHVERLLFDQDDGKQHRVFPPSFFMHLAHFQNVRQFDLENYRFASFTDLRRLVAALPGLVNMSLRWVSWRGDLDPVRPLLRATKWKVRYVTTRRCTSDMCPLWFWIVPPPSNRDIGLRGAFGESSHPGLKQDHAKIISQVIRILVDNRLVSWHTVWHCVSQSGAHNLACRYNVEDLDDSPEDAFYSFEWTPSEQVPRMSDPMVDRIGREPATALVYSLLLELNSDLRPLEWQKLDAQLLQLDGLHVVRIDVRTYVPPPPKERVDMARAIFEKFVYTRAKCRFEVIIGGTEVPEDILVGEI